MALIKYGSLAGAVSGSLGNQVFSHNRYGAYVRSRVVPTKVVNENTLGARGRLAAVSQNWGDLTAAQQLAWATWADANPITNRLGDKQVLSGNAAYCQLNARILLAGGTEISVPPVVGAPSALLTMVTTFDIGSGTSTIAFTPTPLAASEHLYVQGAVLVNPGQRYFRNKLKLIHVGAAAGTSPYDYQTALEARFGPLAVGNRVVLMAGVLDEDTGLLSSLYMDEGVITSAA